MKWYVRRNGVLLGRRFAARWGRLGPQARTVNVERSDPWWIVRLGWVFVAWRGRTRE